MVKRATEAKLLSPAVEHCEEGLSYLLSFVQRRQIAALGRVLPLQGSVLPPIATNIVGSLLIEQ